MHINEFVAINLAITRLATMIRRSIVCYSLLSFAEYMECDSTVVPICTQIPNLSNQKSLLETWTDIPSTGRPRRDIMGYVPLIMSGAGALTVAPFAVIRWISGEWLLAIIDAVIVTGFVTLGTYVYRTRKVRAASIALTVVFVGGAMATVFVRGSDQVFWVFPALMATFFMVKPREAIVVALLVVLALGPLLVNSMELFRAATIIITIVMTCCFAFVFSEINNRQHGQLLELASRDSLTGAGNHRAFRRRLARVIASFERTSTPASIIVLDIDHFKEVNDTYGHSQGDKMLRRISQIIDMRMRVTDGLYRIGGEEFVAVIEGQHADVAAQLAEELRILVEKHELLPNISITVSLGVAELHKGETHHDWFQRADKALYEAKSAGRNVTRVAR